MEKTRAQRKMDSQRMTGQETRNKLTDYWASHEIKLGAENWWSRARASCRQASLPTARC